jgi:hypothetical protein
MSSKGLFNTDKENVPNNILPIIGQPEPIQEKSKPAKKVKDKTSDYYVKKQQLTDLKEENARLKTLLEKTAIVEPVKIAEPVKAPEPVKIVEPVKPMSTIEEIVKTMRPTKGKFW